MLSDIYSKYTKLKRHRKSKSLVQWTICLLQKLGPASKPVKGISFPFYLSKSNRILRPVLTSDTLVGTSSSEKRIFTFYFLFLFHTPKYNLLRKHTFFLRTKLSYLYIIWTCDCCNFPYIFLKIHLCLFATYTFIFFVHLQLVHSLMFNRNMLKKSLIYVH